MDTLSTFGAPLVAALIKGFALGLLAGLLLLAVARRTGLLRRGGGFRKFLACCWYLYVPLVLGSGGALWYAADSMIRMQTAMFDPIRTEVTAASTQATEELLGYLKMRLPDDPELLTKELVQGMVADYVDKELFKGMLQEERLPALAQATLQTLRQPVVAVVMEHLTDSFIKKLATATALDVEDIREAWDKGIVHAMSQGLVMKLIEQNFNRRFAAIRSLAWKAGAVLLLPVLLEVATALYARRRKEQAGGLPQGSA